MMDMDISSFHKNDIDIRQTHGFMDIQVDKATKSKTAEHKTGKKKTKIQEWKTWKTDRLRFKGRLWNG